MSDGRYRGARRGVAAMKVAEMNGYGTAGRGYVKSEGGQQAVRVTDDWRKLRKLARKTI